MSDFSRQKMITEIIINDLKKMDIHDLKNFVSRALRVGHLGYNEVSEEKINRIYNSVKIDRIFQGLNDSYQSHPPSVL